MRAAIALATLMLVAAQAQGATKPVKTSDLAVIAEFRMAPDALTTDLVSSLDPAEVNPHRQRWVLERRVKLRNLKAEPRPDGSFGVSAAAVESHAKGWARAAGPWYKSLSEFSCAASPDPSFATAEGTRQAAEFASREWDTAMQVSRDQLRIRLSRLTASTAALALQEAGRELADWVDGIDQQWRDEGRVRARAEEWKSYSEAASTEGHCTGKPAKTRPPVSWRKMMETPPPAQEPGEGMTSILARAPARRWNGMFSVRLTIRVGATRSLSGQFLVDTSAPRTIFDPGWLKAQGVLPAWIELPRTEPEVAVFSGGRGMGRRASVLSIELAGYKLPISEVLLRETEIFSPPDNLAVCCDGVIGMDILRRVVAEFRAGPPAEVVLWQQQDFRAPFGGQSVWIETALGEDHQPVSDACLTGSDESLKQPELPGVRWNTASEGALEIHPPWRSRLKSRHASWDIHCDDDLAFADDVIPDPAREETSLTVAKHPAVTVGMSLLSRGNFVLDLPHGRMWFPGTTLALPVRENKTGLTLVYDYVKGERVLRVAGVRPTSRLQPLIKAGLSPGSQVLAVDAKPVDEADLWEIDQHLGGAYGNSVELRWKSGAKVKQGRIALEGKPR